MDKMDVNGKEYNVIKLLGHGKGGYMFIKYLWNSSG